MTNACRRVLSSPKLGFLEFFAGSGLVAEGLQKHFNPAWANDNCPKKAATYKANHPRSVLHLGSIEEVHGSGLPFVPLAWASFPCQDLSLAGAQVGLKGERSGLVWQWLRVIKELPQKPLVLVAENVEGLVSSNRGQQYRELHHALLRNGYKAGVLLIDAVHWLPQSRPRVFVVAVPRTSKVEPFSTEGPTWAHPKSVVLAATGLPDWIWWNIKKPSTKRKNLSDLLDWDAPNDDEHKTRHNLELLSSVHQKRLLLELANGFRAAPGYKRTRNGKQVLELRFDNVAGCLRTPEGGSSRQLLVLKKGGQLVTRLLTVREAGRLMGVRESYKIVGSYNDGYRAMGDAVAVPVVRYLADNLLAPLVRYLNR